jgi:hypothetical protein
MYINLKGMIGMPLTGCYVWSHAYEHANLLLLCNMAFLVG